MEAAVIADQGPDAGVAWHYGDPVREQRTVEGGAGLVDLSHRDVLRIDGPERLSWLHALTTQHLLDLRPGQGTTTLVLSPQGHIEHVLYGVDDGQTFWAHTEPGAGPAAAEWLDRMRFLTRVEVNDVSSLTAVVWSADPGPDPAQVLAARTAPDTLGGADLFVPRERVQSLLGRGQRVGTWAYEARRIAAGVPRIGVDTDHRTIPNEVGLLGSAVHLDKGCYRGQETVARVHTLGRPPRRLVLLQLDGSADRLPPAGTAAQFDGRTVGFVGSSVRHHELGPIALGLVKRSVDVTAPLLVDGIAAAQEPLVDPEVGLHVRPRLASS